MSCSPYAALSADRARSGSASDVLRGGPGALLQLHAMIGCFERRRAVADFDLWKERESYLERREGKTDSRMSEII